MQRLAPDSQQGSASALSLAPRCGDILPADVWYMIFHALETHGRRWLYNACLVCRKFYALARHSLYRRIVLEENWRDGACNGLHRFIGRLEDESSQGLRKHVREVTIANIGKVDLLFKALEVVSRLPNLRNVILHSCENLPPRFIEALLAHPRRPTLELLDQDGAMKPPGKLTPVATLHAAVDVGAGIHEGPNSRLLDLQKLVFHCPNLRSLSLTVVDQHDQCNLRHLMFPSITNFHLTESDVFPPIKDLSLNGYRIGHLEWPHWRDGFRWEGLSSLSLGPQPDRHSLGLLTGYLRNLRHFTLLAYNQEESLPAEDIDRFLMSFNCLAHLVIRGHSCSVEAVGNHPRLTQLCLHECERSPEQLAQLGSSIHRKTLTASDLELLHLRCPYIEELEIDCNRRDGQWPEDILLTLATRFTHLRYLSIHLELGIANIHTPITPVLNYASAQRIGEAFFAMRFPRILHGLTIKTGEPLRRFPRGEPLYRKWEQLHSVTFDIRPRPFPATEIDASHVEREVLRGMRLKDELDPTNPVDLQLRVEAAVHGACAHSGWDGKKRGRLGDGTPIRMHSSRAILA